MYPEARPMPYQQSQLYYSYYDQGAFVYLPYELIKLEQEKSFLSKGLADCVTYLKALRTKQTNNTRRLNTMISAAPKKKKRMQQTKRHLDSEIKHRERDEQAFLNNLQACEANIFLASMAYQPYNTPVQRSVLTTPTLYTPTLCSHSGSEATDLSWEGWTDEALVSPFDRRVSDAYFVDNVAYPEVLRCDSTLAKDVKRPPPLFQGRTMDLSNSLFVPPNTAQSHFDLSSILSPTAIVFEPLFSSTNRMEEYALLDFDRLSISSSVATTCVEPLQQRCCSAAPPQQPRQKEMRVQTSRTRANSI